MSLLTFFRACRPTPRPSFSVLSSQLNHTFTSNSFQTFQFPARTSPFYSNLFHKTFCTTINTEDEPETKKEKKKEKKKVETLESESSVQPAPKPGEEEEHSYKSDLNMDFNLVGEKEFLKELDPIFLPSKYPTPGMSRPEWLTITEAIIKESSVERFGRSFGTFRSELNQDLRLHYVDSRARQVENAAEVRSHSARQNRYVRKMKTDFRKRIYMERQTANYFSDLVALRSPLNQGMDKMFENLDTAPRKQIDEEQLGWPEERMHDTFLKQHRSKLKSKKILQNTAVSFSKYSWFTEVVESIWHRLPRYGLQPHFAWELFVKDFNPEMFADTSDIEYMKTTNGLQFYRPIFLEGKELIKDIEKNPGTGGWRYLQLAKIIDSIPKKKGFKESLEMLRHVPRLQELEPPEDYGKYKEPDDDNSMKYFEGEDERDQRTLASLRDLLLKLKRDREAGKAPKPADDPELLGFTHGYRGLIPIDRKRFPIEFIHRSYIGKTDQQRRMERRVRARVYIPAFDLPPVVLERFVKLAGPRYDPQSQMLTVSADKYQNKFTNTREIRSVIGLLFNQSYLADGNFVSILPEENFYYEGQILHDRLQETYQGTLTELERDAQRNEVRELFTEALIDPEEVEEQEATVKRISRQYDFVRVLSQKTPPDPRSDPELQKFVSFRINAFPTDAELESNQDRINRLVTFLSQFGVDFSQFFEPINNNNDNNTLNAPNKKINQKSQNQNQNSSTSQ